MTKTRVILKYIKYYAALIAAIFLLYAVFSIGFNVYSACAAETETNQYGEPSDCQQQSARVSALASGARQGGEPFAGGDGSENFPFLIETPEQLNNVRNYAINKIIIGDPNVGGGNTNSNTEDEPPVVENIGPGYHFKVTNDIDMEEYLSKGGGGYEQLEEIWVEKWDETLEEYYHAKEYEKWGEKGWRPITEFSGVFDGGGYTIKNLWINRPDENGVGLFGYCIEPTIKNIRLVLSDKGITGPNNVGGIAAKLYNQNTDKSAALVSDCSVTGDIKAANAAKPAELDFEIMSNAGGIVGDIYNGTVLECVYSGTVSGLCAVGGIAGVSFKGDISDCLSYGKITLTSSNEHISIAGAGGIVGVAYGGSGDIRGNAVIMNCFYEARQTDSRVAAIVGFRKDIDADGKINSNYAALPQVTGCYYNSGVFSGSLTHIEDIVEFDTTDYGGGIFTQPFEPVNSGALNAKQMKNKSSYKDWDFENTWGFDKDDNLVLRAFGNAYDPPSLTWLWVTLGCVVFGAAAVCIGIILYRRKKTQIITETNTVTVEKEVRIEVPVEVPIIKKPLPADLSEQELRIARMVLKGKSLKRTADELGLTKTTIQTHMERVYIKAGVNNQKEFIAYFTFED